MILDYVYDTVGQEEAERTESSHPHHYDISRVGLVTNISQSLGGSFANVFLLYSETGRSFQIDYFKFLLGLICSNDLRLFTNREDRKTKSQV